VGQVFVGSDVGVKKRRGADLYAQVVSRRYPSTAYEMILSMMRPPSVLA
jgi:hypothetical protein